MEIAIISYYAPAHFEVWFTDLIETGAGLGDVFDTREEALACAVESGLPMLDLTHIISPDMEGDELWTFMSEYLELTPSGDITGVKKPESGS